VPRERRLRQPELRGSRDQFPASDQRVVDRAAVGGKTN